MQMYYIHLLSVSFCMSLSVAVELDVVGGSIVQCSGSTVTLRCTLPGDYLIWITPHGAINLRRGRTAGHDVSNYQPRLMELNMTYLTSNLTFTYTSQITINCSQLSGEPSNSITLSTEGTPGAPERPLTSLERIERVNKTFSLVSVLWEIPTANNAHISSYVVTVDPPISLPDDGVIAADNPLFNSRQLTLTLQHDQQYNIRVRANSCNDRVNGTTSDPLTINIQVPPDVMRCTALPVYGYNSITLSRMEIEWDSVADIGEEITSSITANVQDYIILVDPIGIPAPAINVTLGADDRTVCSNTKCHHTLQSTGEMLALYYSVYVIAKNLLSNGYSEGHLCNNTTLSTRNDLLSVDLRRNFTDMVEVLCRPLSRYEGRASCQVVYSVLPDGDTYTEESDSVGGAEDTISVFLTNTEPGSDISVSVATRGGKQNIIVEGTFKIGDIVSSRENLRCFLCPEPSPTSKATTTSPASEIPDEDQISCPVAPWILAGGIFIITLPIGLVVGIIVMLVYNSKKKSTDNNLKPYYDYIIPNTISTASNSCYSLSQAPELPKPRKRGL